jgi:hypothetical protein
MVISTRRADLLHFVFGRPVESTADFCLSSPAENGQKQTLTDIPFWTDRLPSSRCLSLLSDFEVNIDGDE